MGTNVLSNANHFHCSAIQYGCRANLYYDDSKVVLNRSRLLKTWNSCIWTAKWSTKHDHEPCCKSTCFLLICHQAIFSITDPNHEVYLVVRIEKVLQGSISSCIEPYLKSGDTKKAAQKAHKWAEICCKSLGQYGMPFGWTARWGYFRLMLGNVFSRIRTENFCDSFVVLFLRRLCCLDGQRGENTCTSCFSITYPC